MPYKVIQCLLIIWNKNVVTMPYPFGLDVYSITFGLEVYSITVKEIFLIFFTETFLTVIKFVICKYFNYAIKG